MKRLLSLVTISFLIMFGVQAQQTIVEVDEKGLNKRLEKSDEAILNPKKSLKASVWFSRGELLTEVANAPTKGLYLNLTKAQLITTFGDPISYAKKTVRNKEHDVMVYPYFDVYLFGDKVAFWDVTKEIKKDALDLAVEAFRKAYELDESMAVDVDVELASIINLYKEKGGSLNANKKYIDAARMFRNSYYLGLDPVIGEEVIDTISIFNAGYISTIGLSYEVAIKDFREALKYEYDVNGETHYFVFHCYYGLKDTVNARVILEEGFAKYPMNNNIMEGLLSLYTATGADPAKTLPLILRAIERYPNNSSLWSGLGGLYEQLNMPDESLKAFTKAAEISPDDYVSQFNLGLLYIRKGDIIGDELNKKDFTSQDDYDTAFKDVFDYYIKGLVPLEKAAEIRPTDKAVLELLRSITFRVRDKKGQEGKYEKYDAMLKAL